MSPGLICCAFASSVILVGGCFPDVPAKEDTTSPTGSTDTGLVTDSTAEEVSDTQSDSQEATDSVTVDTTLPDSTNTETDTGSTTCEPVCANGGVCLTNGSCDCAGTGFTGASCTEAPESCPTSTHRCLPAPPEPWLGPFALRAGQAACDALFPTEVGKFHSGLESGGTTECSCSCGAPMVECNDKYAGWFNNPGCPGDPSDGGDLEFGVCRSALPPPYYDSFEVGLFPSTVSAACAVGEVSSSVPISAWTQTWKACAHSGQLACSEPQQRCTPRLVSGFSSATYCVVTPGDFACPTSYPERSLRYASVQDTRGCASSCQCDASPAVCASTVDRWTNDSCSGAAADTDTIYSGGERLCAADGQTYFSTRVRAATVYDAGSCEAETLAPEGVLAATDAHTVCCVASP